MCSACLCSIPRNVSCCRWYVTDAVFITIKNSDVKIELCCRFIFYIKWDCELKISVILSSLSKTVKRPLEC